MQLARRLLWAGVALVGAAALSIVLFVFFGAALPIWTMIAIYGRSAVQDAPAHGGAILFATLPIAGITTVPVFIFLAETFYRKVQLIGPRESK